MDQAPLDPLAPGAVIGVLGGGQLGRMAALAAARLGYRCHIFCPEPEAPAYQVTDLATRAPYDDETALAGFAQEVDVVTFEFENIPFQTVDFLAGRVPVRPRPEILRICQNRVREKDFCRSIGVPTAAYAAVAGPQDLDRAVARVGRPCVLKTAEMGYDGKGQAMIGAKDDLARAWHTTADAATSAGAIAEAFVDFRLEISVLVARAADGTCRTYDPVENRHRNHILHQTIVPAPIAPETAEHALEIARRLAQELDLVGLLAIEMFVTQDGDVLVNELAPRPHNSGHWTLDACLTSQFEQFIRAVAGLPLGGTARLADGVMTNLLGEEAERWREILAEPEAKLHLYGKHELRPGRKMGHVTRLKPIARNDA
jgi:5-(carboxyamino)imidazole ribonucleotide synthase